MKLRSPFKIKSCYNSYYSVFNCSNVVTICSIPNVCGDTSQQIRSMINTETAVLKTKNIQTINTSSNNLVINFTNPSPLKDRTRLNLYDDSSLFDNIKSISSPLSSTVNVIFVPPKIWRPKSRKHYKLMLCTNVDEDFYVYTHCAKSMVLSPSSTPRPRSDIIFGCSSLYQK